MSSRSSAEIAAVLKAAADHKAYVTACRKEFETTPNIYAIEYVYRHHYWSTDRRGRVRAVSYVGKKRADDPGLVFWKTTPAGVMVAVKTLTRELAFGWSRLTVGDKWNKYIGLHGALRRASEWTGEYYGRVGAWTEFIARQRDRLVASRNRKLYGNEAGEVSTTARGDTRVEVKR